MQKEDIGKWILSERHHGQETRATLCEGIGKSPMTVFGYEKGTVFPSLETLEDIAEFFGYELDIQFVRKDEE